MVMKSFCSCWYWYARNNILYWFSRSQRNFGSPDLWFNISREERYRIRQRVEKGLPAYNDIHKRKYQTVSEKMKARKNSILFDHFNLYNYQRGLMAFISLKIKSLISVEKKRRVQTIKEHEIFLVGILK